MAISIRNWKKFQHFKDRRPPWIKVYRALLEDRDISALSDKTFRVLVGLWLLASEDQDMEGKLPSVDDIAFRLRLSKPCVDKALCELVSFVYQDDINVIPKVGQVVPPETETETETETEKEKRQTCARLFEIWWNKYDKKRGRDKVESKWLTLKEAEMQLCLDSVDAYVRSTPEKQFRKDPATYLNQKCWGDEIYIDTDPKATCFKCEACGKPWVSGMTECSCGGKFVRG